MLFMIHYESITTQYTLDNRMTAIEFENIGKQYRLGLVSTQTLSHDLNRWWQTSVLGKEDPYLRIGEVNDRSTKGESEYVWALRDINFKVEQGDVVGIIGKNGAGKSTLLKLLSRVTTPTTGTIRARGRIASLLEVGTGFHPELTGRENIYMNGAIMGMTKQEIASKLDEIVDFSGCERYLDTPVKRYSSGMTVRLGFAVAAHLDPEILVVDEVLAVGDAEFQKKALGKMQSLSHGEGRTVLFVSHNMASVRALCKNGILLKNGIIDKIGDINSVATYYLSNYESELLSHTIIEPRHHDSEVQREIEYLSIKTLNNIQAIGSEEELRFVAKIKRNDIRIHQCQFGIVIRDIEDHVIGADYSDPIILPEQDKMDVHMAFPQHNLARGTYKLNFNITHLGIAGDGKDYDIVRDVIRFKVTHVDSEHTKPFIYWPWASGIRYNTLAITLS